MGQQKTDAQRHPLPPVIEDQGGDKKAEQHGDQKVQHTVHHIGRKQKKTKKVKKKLPETNQADIRKKGAGIKPRQ